MCVWITVESVFQCLGTDTSCPTRALSLIPEKIYLGEYQRWYKKIFRKCFCFCMPWNAWILCLSMLCFVMMWLGFSKMLSGDFQQIGHGSNSCYGFKWDSVQSKKTQTSACHLLHIHSDQCGHGWLLHIKIKGCVQLAKSSVSAQSYKRY